MSASKNNKLIINSTRTILLITLLVAFLFDKNCTAHVALKPSDLFKTQNTNDSYFNPIYAGNGVNHMNINLVNLGNSSLKAGDEIGVFDGIYCVGATVILDSDLKTGLLSIAASANDTLESKPNGYITGHKIKLKLYRNNSVYELYFDLVDNSKDIFTLGGTMFAFVDFSRSTGNTFLVRPYRFNIYPDPVKDNLEIELNFFSGVRVNCKIFDSLGKLIKLFPGEVSEDNKAIVWDCTDDYGQKVNPGFYYIRMHNVLKKVVLAD